MRRNDKIAEIKRYLDELVLILPENFREYEKDIKSKAACERYFEKIIEAIVDLAFIVIKENRFRMPEDDKEAFKILQENNMIPENLAIRLKEAKGMRNILAHQYGSTDNEIVFNAIKNELSEDALEFVKMLTKNSAKDIYNRKK